MAVYFTRKQVPRYVYMTGAATISGTPLFSAINFHPPELLCVPIALFNGL